MTTIAIIQARLGSQRLPGKSLMPLAGRPLIAHVIERVASVADVSNIVLAVPATDAARFREVVECPVYADPLAAEMDVLARFAGCAAAYPAEAYLRVTGDCPLFAPDVADRVLRRFREERADYAWTDTAASGWPDGTDVEVFTAALLAQTLADPGLTASDREHVTPAMRRQPGARIVTVPAPRVYRHKWSVDDREDLARVAAILARRPKDFSVAATLACAE